MGRKRYNIGGDNIDNSGMVYDVLWVVGIVLAVSVILCWIASCSPKVIVQKETVTEYRDRIVHDTTTVEIPLEVEKVVTKDTASHLENTYAKSDAVVSGGFLSHSLESRPQVIKVPFEVHVHDTLVCYKEAQTIEKEVPIEKPLSWWQSLKIGAFWWLLGAVVAILVFVFRKPILKLLKLWLHF